MSITTSSQYLYYDYVTVSQLNACLYYFAVMQYQKCTVWTHITGYLPAEIFTISHTSHLTDYTCRLKFPLSMSISLVNHALPTLRALLTNNQRVWHNHTHTYPFNGPLSATTWVSWYQKGKTNLDFTEARDSGISWATCKSAPRPRQINTPGSPHHSVFLQAGCPSCHPTNSINALKALTQPKVQ